jgi:hypothetical protein
MGEDVLADKSAELYGILKQLGANPDPKVLAAALQPVMREPLLLATSLVPPKVTDVTIRPADYKRESGDPGAVPSKYSAKLETSVDDSVGRFTLQKVRPDGIMEFSTTYGSPQGMSNQALTLAQTIRYLENCMTLGKQLASISTDVARGRGPVYRMCQDAAVRQGIPLNAVKSIVARYSDDRLRDLEFMSNPEIYGRFAPEFFTSY